MKSDWFKNKTKFVVGRGFTANAVHTVIVDNDTILENTGPMDAVECRGIADGSAAFDYVYQGERSFVIDGSVVDDDDVSDLPWHERFLTLKRGLDWGGFAVLSRPIIVTSRDEMRKAISVYELLPSSNGATVFDYNATYPVERNHIPPEAL